MSANPKMEIGQRVVYLTSTGERRKGKVEILHSNEERATILPRKHTRGRKPTLDTVRFAFNAKRNRWEHKAA